ncbi:MAG: diaminohydroxyphosphoribosylaminopyrimidine deaminase [Herbinix sp.]|jgi:diaminohydroxyphosphoribosylaminopyrimidine deaminase/5-amino-6-(5-phosphoribosylamino)uracil reductase|nr:diaminohydroxyphosphoribosylaminopyrimidine deaminase [Herbinix sp.]
MMNLEFMKRAINLANQGSGFVNPDPLSGAVLVKDNKIISEGFYEMFGGEPAELAVLRKVEGDLTGSELYLNIEPFHGEKKTQECLDLIEAKGIAKVWIGIRDNQPGTKIDFLKELENRNISYELGILQEECEEQNEIYSYYSRTKEPYVVVKWAMTLDGKLATKTGDSKWISSEGSLHFVHQLRQRVAAILVGENTVRQDNPMLTTRLEGVTISNPLRVVVTKYGDIPLDSKVLQVDENVKTLIIASEFLPKERESELLQLGVQIAKLPERNGRIDFHDIMKLLGSRNIDSLYIEGGSAILASAFESNCVHKVYTAIAPKIVGGKTAYTPVSGNGIEYMRDAIVLKRVSHEIIGPDVIVKGYL